MGGNRTSELDVQAELSAARADLVAVLEQLEEPDWDKSTLCEGWRVRDVASHIAQAPDLKVGKVLGGMLKARGKLDKMRDEQARRGGDREPAVILQQLRDNVANDHVPPRATAEQLLADTVIHSLDIVHPNGWKLNLPADRVRFVLSTMVKLSGPFRGKERAEGLHFDTTDVDWRCGCGDHVRGPAPVVLLALAGRPVCDQLSGDGVAELAAR